MIPAWRVLLAIGGIYAAQGLVGAMAFRGVPAVLREAGVALDRIGLVSLLMLPWALKFLWSPAVERYRLPAAGVRRSARIILPGQALVAVLLVAAALTVPGELPLFVMGLMMAVALASATVDIACDGFAVEQLRKGLRGLGNTMQVGGSYLGFLIGGGVFLILVASWGWPPAVLAMAGLVILLSLPSAGMREGGAAAPTHRPSLGYALRRPEVRLGLCVVLVFQAGLRLGQGMVSPFLIDRGFDLATLGLVYGAVGTGASVAGTLIAGGLLRRLDGGRVLIGCLILQFVMLLLLTGAALYPDVGRTALVGLVLVKGMVAAAGFVALYTQMMGWSSLRQAGIDFTLFQCADAAIGAVAGVVAGLLAQHFGYRACFGAAACLSLAALAVVPMVLSAIASRRVEEGIA